MSLCRTLPQARRDAPIKGVANFEIQARARYMIRLQRTLEAACAVAAIATLSAFPSKAAADDGTAAAGDGSAAAPRSSDVDLRPAPRITTAAPGVELPLPVETANPNPWASVALPSRGPSHSIGGYSGGCLGGAAVMPLRGRGFRVMRPQRRRHFGHRILIKFLEDLGRGATASGAQPLAIGDLSMPRGGPTPNGHASHQSGLDVDIAYGGATASNPSASLVDEARNTVNKRWNRRILEVLRRAATDPRVARIFVHPAIKAAACDATRRWREEQRTWLRTLRPWWGHDDHFHVRLACPVEDDECVAQPDLPDGDGCDELSWWFDPARAEERAKEKGDYRGRVAARPELPKSCEAVLASANR